MGNTNTILAMASFTGGLLVHNESRWKSSNPFYNRKNSNNSEIRKSGLPPPAVLGGKSLYLTFSNSKKKGLE